MATLTRWALGAGACVLVVRALRRSPNVFDREGWMQVEDAAGLAVRWPSRSWTSPAVRSLLERAGRKAAQLGGALQVADVGPAVRGSSYPPHKSHAWGRDVDAGYDLATYPTPPDVAVDPRIVQVLASIAPWIEVVGVGGSRVDAFTGAPFKVDVWSGHKDHMHVRLRRELVSARATA